MDVQHGRLPVALHLPQELIPPSGASVNASALVSVDGARTARAGGSGYGPVPVEGGTSLSKIVRSSLYVPAAEPTPSEAANGWQGHAGARTDFDSVCVPLTNASWRERWERMCTIATSETASSDLHGASRVDGSQDDVAGLRSRREAELWRAGGAFRRGEVNVTNQDDTSEMIGMSADWLELDSPVEGLRFDSELALRQEISYASYLSIATVILAPPRFENRQYLADYARAINGALASSWHLRLSIRMPVAFSADALSQTAAAQPEATSIRGLEAEDNAAWEAWNQIRSLCNYSPRLSLTLELCSILPPPATLSRWSAEPIRYVFLPCYSFIPNAKGYPVLSRSMQAFLKGIFKFKPTVILSGTHRNLHAAGGRQAYAQYVRYLHRKMGPLSPIEDYAQGYLDHLQTPLQPLMDNLESETYEGFEKDPIKYRQYEEAIHKALSDRPTMGTTAIFVVGAGRGPLVAASLRAAERSRRQVRITAVEKNPNAFVVLQERAALEWGSAVELVFSDMRSFAPRQTADIIVSELLGSFGDNELSPECLDGVMRFLNPDGVSIPTSYTAFLAPVSTSKLHSDVMASTPVGVTSPEARPSEQPYVVMFSSAHLLSGATDDRERVQECWSFDHPNPDITLDDSGLPITNHHNARSAHLSFSIPQAGVCHGFAGYFEAILYDDIGLSIHPERSNGEMLSWFPIFFPIQDPIYLPANCELDVQIWRMTDGQKRKVWFEWSAEAFLSLPATALGTASPQSNADNSSRRNSSPRTQRAVRLSGESASPMMDAFARGMSPQPSNEQVAVETHDQVTRIKIAMSRLHNPGGRTSYVGL